MPVKSLLKKVADEHFDVARLIHQGTLGIEASIAGLAERYLRGKTSHTLHVWWARRPHSAMRSLVFESACRSIDKTNSDTAVMLAAGIEDGLVRARKRLSADYGPSGPAILDMFGGGGTIPFEAAFLGAAAHSIDYNALSIFIQKSNLVMSQQALAKLNQSKLSRIAESYGTQLLQRVKERTDDLYDRTVGADRSIRFAYFWSYEKSCSDCGYSYLLSKRPWLSKKSGKTLSIQVMPGSQHDTVKQSVESEATKTDCWGGRSAETTCPMCSQKSRATIVECRDVTVATGYLTKPTGKRFVVGLDQGRSSIDLQARKEALLIELGAELPASRLPKWSGIVNPSIYGMETHAQIFNARQTVVFLELTKAIRETHSEIVSSHGAEVADYLTSVLSSLLDQYIDWNCRLSMWISQNEQVGRAFCGPGVPMLWDYVETDALQKGPANLWDKLSRIVSTIETMPKFEIIPNVQAASAQQLPFLDDTFDAIVTDPPYYDNIFYNILSDFFYSWKRMALGPIFPKLFVNPQTDDIDELVASSIRQGGSDAAHSWYCDALSRALSEAFRTLKPDGILSFVYSHSSLRGWLAIVSAFRSSGLHIDTVEPLSIERRQRPRAMTSEAVNTCVVLVARRASVDASAVSLVELSARVAIDLQTYGSPLENAGWANEDIGMALVARAASYIANVPSVGGSPTDEYALENLSKIIQGRYTGFKLQKRKSL